MADAEVAASLPLLHRDPFDRMLVGACAATRRDDRLAGRALEPYGARILSA